MNKNYVLNIGKIKISNDLPFVLIAGPCQVETLDHSLYMAEHLYAITSKLNIPFIYKSSFDKANRTSVHGKRGAGLDASLEIFRKIKEKINCLIITDVHKEDQCKIVADVVDVLQIPALLCRQTDLLEAAARTKKPVNVKKGQFLSPWDVKNIVDKLSYFGCEDVLLTERGTSFGYNTLVSDMRSIPVMAQQTRKPIVFDATHSVQTPGGLAYASGGNRDFVKYLARAAITIGVAALFLEVHQDPDNAPSDGPCMIQLSQLESMLQKLKLYDAITKESE